MRSVIDSIKSVFSSRPAHDSGKPDATLQEKVLTGPLAEADALLKEGKAYPALKLLETFLREKPGDADAGVLHGLCLEQAGRHEEAFKIFHEVLARHPRNLKALERHNILTTVLRRPPAPAVPDAQRSWHTSLPRDTVMQIELGTHHYRYRGVPLIKNPFDFALYHVLLWNVKPRSIIEIGSKSGGSALWLGDLLNTYGMDGHVHSVDIVQVKDVSHPRVTFLEGDGQNLGPTLTPDLMAGLPRPLLVIEDADHSYETSIAALRFFDRWLAKGEYIIVEDGILSDIMPDRDSGPHRALKEFLGQHPGRYQMASEYCDFFGYNVTWCTNGYLRKIAD